jgi:hypothetical protein
VHHANGEGEARALETRGDQYLAHPERAGSPAPSLPPQVREGGMKILEMVLTEFWPFWAALILICVVLTGLAEIVKAFRGRP